jgi:hypothetical protein
MALVRRRFAATFDASTSAQPDSFLVAYEARTADAANHRVLACAGITVGRDRPFFCERYLPGPAEQVVSEYLGRPCPREEIMEVGQIASDGPGAAGALLGVLPVFGWESGMRYAVMTVTDHLGQVLAKHGYPFEPIVEARPEHLPVEEREKWGRYYDAKPWTGLIRLEKTGPVLARSAGRYRAADLLLTLVDDGEEPRLAVA